MPLKNWCSFTSGALRVFMTQGRKKEGEGCVLVCVSTLSTRWQYLPHDSLVTAVLFKQEPAADSDPSLSFSHKLMWNDGTGEISHEPRLLMDHVMSVSIRAHKHSRPAFPPAPRHNGDSRQSAYEWWIHSKRLLTWTADEADVNLRSVWRTPGPDSPASWKRLSAAAPPGDLWAPRWKSLAAPRSARGGGEGQNEEREGRVRMSCLKISPHHLHYWTPKENCVASTLRDSLTSYCRFTSQFHYCYLGSVTQMWNC